MIDWQGAQAGMIAPEEAQARILALGVPLEAATVSLPEASGFFLSEDIQARRTQPARNLSAMDGYAVRFAELPGPWTVAGESGAGAPYPEHAYVGEAVRIFTGAIVPTGVDTVIVQENVTRVGDTLLLTGAHPTTPGENIRQAGSDFRYGATLLESGTRLSPAAIALASVANYFTVAVRRLVRVGICSTGNELVPSGNACEDHELPDSNSGMIKSLMHGLPVEIRNFGIVRDEREDLLSLFQNVDDLDILVTTGGASVGDHDLVRPTLIEAGASIDFWKVAMRPGKPLMAGTLGTTIVLGLPGNPVSAFVTATLFLLPLVRHLSGARDPLPRRIAAQCNAALPAVGPRTDFVRARWDGGALAPLPSTDSGVLSSLARADAIIVRAAGSAQLSADAQVEAILLT